MGNVDIKKSVCNDCKWMFTCQQLFKINGKDIEKDNLGLNDNFQVVIVKCSVQNYDRRYNSQCSADEEGMYYCPICNMMHHSWSVIGKKHKMKGDVIS